MNDKIIQIMPAPPGTYAVYANRHEGSTTQKAIPCLCLVEFEDQSGTFVDGWDGGRICSEYTNFLEILYFPPLLPSSQTVYVPTTE